MWTNLSVAFYFYFKGTPILHHHHQCHHPPQLTLTLTHHFSTPTTINNKQFKETPKKQCPLEEFLKKNICRDLKALHHFGNPLSSCFTLLVSSRTWQLALTFWPFLFLYYCQPFSFSNSKTHCCFAYGYVLLFCIGGF